MKLPNLTAVVQREDDMYVAHCPELDVASQGHTPEEAHANLVEAVEAVWEFADESEIERRLRSGATVAPLRVAD